MRTASILLTLVVVVGFVREAGAADYSIAWGEQYFGIADTVIDKYESIDANGNCINVIGSTDITVLHFGPLGYNKVPFTATQGLVGFGLILAMLIVVPVVLAVRWKRKQETS